jgi:hypothetical protein
MKSNKIMLFVATMVLSFSAFAQSLNVPAASPTQTLKQAFGTADISLEYSRPSANGRVIFGNIVPLDKTWRTGANSSTKITFGSDVKLEGNAVKAGTYAIYSVPGKESWDIMLYKDLTLGGNVGDYKTENEVLRFKVKPTKLNDKVESFTMNFDGFKPTATKLELSWENTKVSIGITTDIDATIMKNIEKILINDSRPFYSAATYYYDNNKDMNLAMEWVNKAVSSNPKAYWVQLLKAKIATKLNDKKTAIAAAIECNRLAVEDKDDSYIRQSNELLAELNKK